MLLSKKIPGKEKNFGLQRCVTTFLVKGSAVNLYREPGIAPQ
jgi:hypothetical protein